MSNQISDSPDSHIKNTTNQKVGISLPFLTHIRVVLRGVGLKAVTKHENTKMILAIFSAAFHMYRFFILCVTVALFTEYQLKNVFFIKNFLRPKLCIYLATKPVSYLFSHRPGSLT